MAKSRDASVANYQRGVQFGAERYNSSKGRATQNWVAALSAMGVTPSAARQQKYSAGIAAAQYKQGDGNKWYDNWARALST